MPAAKKTSAKKTRKVAKKAPRKAAPKKVSKPKKSAPKKAPPKKTTKKRVAKKTKAKETVKLPDKVDKELKNKAYILHEIVDRLHVPMKQVAYVGAVMFVLVGLITISAEYFPSVQKQLAQVCDPAYGCDPDASDSNEPYDDPDPDSSNSGSGSLNSDPDSAQEIFEEPIIDFFDNVPSELQGNVKIGFQVLHSVDMYGEVMDRDTGELYDLRIDNLSNENFQFELRETDYEPGDYEVRVYAVGSTQTIVQRRPGNFVILEAVIEEPAWSDPISDPDPDYDPDPIEDVVINTPTDSIEDPVLPDEVPEVDPLAEEESNDQFEEPDLPESDRQTSQFDLIVPSKVFKGREVVEVTSTKDFSKVELFIRHETALQAIFLGEMDEVDETEETVFWSHDFNSNNLPNGTYELFALSELKGDSVSSRSVWVEVFNPVDYSDDEDTFEVSDGLSDRLESAIVKESKHRNFLTIDSDPPAKESSSDEQENDLTDGNVQVNNFFDENKDEINDLLTRYAVAVQTNDPITLDLIKNEIDEVREQFVKKAIAGDEDGVAQIDLELLTRFEDLKKRVDTFETIRKSKTSESLDVDSDGDGISDYDEANVYGTDPNSADSDRDGFIDGVEVARGFDPTDDRPEAVVDYELPTEVVGLTRSDALKVTAVTPLIATGPSDSTAVQAEISGVGLPNSYVTLYIFSSPVIVKVKTEQDGSFVYHFDKELEDGDHEVFVAFTDNTGDILAHSEPFQFVKRAQAFTPVDAAEAEVVTDAPSVVEASTSNSVKVVLGMSVLVLGFILIMFGIYLRQNDPVLENIIAEDDKQTA